MHEDLVAAVTAIASILAAELGHATALDAPVVVADVAGLVLAVLGVNLLGEEGAVGALGDAVALDHVGVEGLALWVFLAFTVFLIVLVGGLGVVGAGVAAFNQQCQLYRGRDDTYTS